VSPVLLRTGRFFEFNPHQLSKVFNYLLRNPGKSILVYIRGEYHKWIKTLQKALDEANEKGFVGERMTETLGGNFSCIVIFIKGAGARYAEKNLH